MNTANSTHNPDKHISHKPRGKTMTMHSYSAIPEQRGQRPRSRACDYGQMHESGKTVVAPVGCVLEEEVRSEYDFRAPEVVPRPEEDPGEDEEVV